MMKMLESVAKMNVSLAAQFLDQILWVRLFNFVWLLFDYTPTI